MLVRIASLTERPLSFFRSISYRRIDSTPNSASREMNFDDLDSDGTKCVNLRLCNVSGCMTEILEIHADQPSLHVVFVPGNPAVGAAGHTEKNWDHGRLYSLQEQIDHKIEFIKVQNIEAPLVLAVYCIGLYPFLALNLQSKKQAVIAKYPALHFFYLLHLHHIIRSRVLSTTVTLFVALLGLLPRRVLRVISELSNGKSWSNTAHEAACSHLPQYHTIRNVLYMARTEFIKKHQIGTL
ncbi:hypothetical protein V6N13_089047 [Hibiscus sabdariffa]